MDGPLVVLPVRFFRDQLDGEIDGAVVELAQNEDGMVTAEVRIPASQPDPYPERRSPEYCWHSWPPRHTDECGCRADEDRIPAPQDHG